MARKISSRPKLVDINAGAADAGTQAGMRGRSPMNQSELAHEAIEDRLVNCQLRPGRYLAMQELQDLVGFGRTPVHQAVNRLAADTLLIVHPRRGLVARRGLVHRPFSKWTTETTTAASPGHGMERVAS